MEALMCFYILVLITTTAFYLFLKSKKGQKWLREL